MINGSSPEMIELFLQEASEHLQFLREYSGILQDPYPLHEDLERLYISAHGVAGTGGTYGFPLFNEVAGKLAQIFQFAMNSTISPELAVPLVEFIYEAIAVLESDLIMISTNGVESEEDIASFKVRYPFAFPPAPQEEAAQPAAPAAAAPPSRPAPPARPAPPVHAAAPAAQPPAAPPPVAVAPAAPSTPAAKEPAGVASEAPVAAALPAPVAAAPTEPKPDLAAIAAEEAKRAAAEAVAKAAAEAAERAASEAAAKAAEIADREAAERAAAEAAAKAAEIAEREAAERAAAEAAAKAAFEAAQEEIARAVAQAAAAIAERAAAEVAARHAAAARIAEENAAKVNEAMAELATVDAPLPAEVLEFFLPEIEEHLQIITDCLLQVEASSNPEEIHRLFRSMHTIKGSAAQVGAHRISTVAHFAEDLVARLRDGELKPTAEIIDLCLDAVDVLKKMLYWQWESEPSFQSAARALLQGLVAAGQPRPEVAPPAEAAPVAEVAPAQAAPELPVPPAGSALEAVAALAPVTEPEPAAVAETVAAPPAELELVAAAAAEPEAQPEAHRWEIVLDEPPAEPAAAEPEGEAAALPMYGGVVEESFELATPATEPETLPSAEPLAEPVADEPLEEPAAEVAAEPAAEVVEQPVAAAEPMPEAALMPDFELEPLSATEFFLAPPLAPPVHHAQAQPKQPPLVAATAPPSQPGDELRLEELEKLAAQRPPLPGMAQSKSVRIGLERLDRMMNAVGELVINRTRMLGRLEELEKLADVLNFSKGRMIDKVNEFQDKYEFSRINASPLFTTPAALPLWPGVPLAGGYPGGGQTGGYAGFGGMGRGGFGYEGGQSEFTELEMDRYDDFGILSRSLTEISADITEVLNQLDGFVRRVDGDIDEFTKLAHRLQDEITQARMVPIGGLFTRIARTVRDAAKASNKKVELMLAGAETELDNNIVQQIADPLLHLVRNAVAHGIETAEERYEAGKPDEGHVALRAYHKGNHIYVEVEDDGRGIDLERVRAAAVEGSFITAREAPALGRRELLELLFRPGFSTASSRTELAGRGVGLDVVQSNVNTLHGEIEIETEKAIGTRFTLKVPLTLIISQALFVQCGAQTYAFPLGFVEEIRRISPSEIEDVGGKLITRVRDVLTEVVRFDEALQLPALQPLNGFLRLVLVNVGGRQVGVIVEEVLRKDEIVIKSLGGYLHNIKLFPGATIAPDGSLILLVDLNRLIMGESIERRPLSVAQSAARLFMASATLPRHEVPAAAVEKVEREKVVVLADDSISVRRFVGRMLEKAGYRVKLACDGLEALEIATSSPCDLVITDLEMPRTNGYELLLHLRQTASTAKVPVMVVTSRAGAKHRDRALKEGAVAFMVKPVQEESFIAQVTELIGVSGQVAAAMPDVH